MPTEALATAERALLEERRPLTRDEVLAVAHEPLEMLPDLIALDRDDLQAAAAAGLDLYEVEYADRDGNSLSGRDRYRSLQISQVFLKASENVALLFDEVEDVFPPLSSDTASLLNRMEASGEGVAGKEAGTR